MDINQLQSMLQQYAQKNRNADAGVMMPGTLPQQQISIPQSTPGSGLLSQINSYNKPSLPWQPSKNLGDFIGQQLTPTMQTDGNSTLPIQTSMVGKFLTSLFG